MPLRQIEIVISKDSKKEFQELLSDDSVEHYWNNSSENSGFQLKVLVDANKTEAFLDKADKIIGKFKNHRIVISAVEATIPRIELNDTDGSDVSLRKTEPWEQPLRGIRVSREELYNHVQDSVQLNSVYIAMVTLSTIVAALGVIRDNTAVVIGAMVIAPLLGPNVGLALSTTLGDFSLFGKALKTNLTGLLVAFLLSFVLGLILLVDETVYQIASRTEVHLSDIALALASGAAGVLAYTIGMSAAVIGVMVAVALLPPLVTAGLLMGDGQFELAYFAFLLLITNVICVNLAAVSTFIIQGVRPKSWYKAEKARKINRIAFVIWMLLVMILALVIWFS